jgi:hypothetical protein
MLFMEKYYVFSNNMMSLSQKLGSVFKITSWNGELATHVDLFSWAQQQHP